MIVLLDVVGRIVGQQGGVSWGISIHLLARQLVGKVVIARLIVRVWTPSCRLGRILLQVARTGLGSNRDSLMHSLLWYKMNYL